jgi:hypothetical protein
VVQWLRLLLPREVSQWVIAALAVLMSLLFLAFFFTDGTDLGLLRASGFDSTERIVQVLQRGPDGQPSKVIVEGGTQADPFVLDDLTGSLVGDRVRVREVPGQVVWSETKYHHASVLPSLLGRGLGPLLAGFAVIFLLNLRWHLKPTTDFTWAPTPRADPTGPPP